MVGQKKWKIDIKWIVILVIVAFLLVFEVFPLFYLLIKSLFSGGSFSWEAYRRVYTYDLNWIALKNTMITAGFTTILGVAIAFPLAFLVGRTDMYGKKFFRTLFVVTYMVPPYVGAMSWLRLLNPNAGVLNKFLMKIFGLVDLPLIVIYCFLPTTNVEIYKIILDINIKNTARVIASVSPSSEPI